MMKFLRKYNKQLLAVFAALLLVVWLGGQAFESAFRRDPLEESIGTVNGQKFVQRDLSMAGAETNILNDVGLPWQKPWIANATQARFDFHPPLDVLDWLLLRQEAERLGLGIPPAQIEGYKQGVGLTPTHIARIANRHGVSGDAIDSAIAGFMRVRSVYNELQSGIFVSEPELRTIAQNVGETVSVRLIGLPAEAFIDDAEEFDEARVVEHYNKWKDTLPGEGDLGAGFKHPDRVQIEYIVANADAVAPTVSISRDEAKAYWQNNKKKFLRPKDDEAETQPAEDDAATQPAEPATPPYYETFMEAEEDVMTELREQRAPGETQRLLSELLTTQLRGAWEDRDLDNPRGFVTAPDPVKSESYVSERVASFVASKPQYANVFEVHRTALVSAEELADLERVGEASAPMASDSPFIMQSALIADEAFNVQGLVEIEPDSSVSSQPLSMYQFSTQPYRDDDGAAYSFRVVNVVPSAAPQSLEEVREQVVRSLRIASAFNRARDAASDLLIKAEETSLKAAWRDMSDLQEMIDKLRETADGATLMWGEQIPPPFARRTYTGDAPIVLGAQSEELVDSAFDAAINFDRSNSQRPKTVVELPEHQLIAVLEIEDYKPLYEEDYLARRDRDKRLITMRRGQQLIADWFAPENIRTRVNYKPPA